MAITYDNSLGNNAQFATSSENLSHSFTVGANGNRVLLLCIETSGNVSQGTPAYNGDNFTLLEGTSDSANRVAQIFYLVSPSTGANNFTITLTRDAGLTWGYAYNLYSYYNVNLGDPIESFVHENLELGDSSSSQSITAGVSGALVWTTAFGDAEDVTSGDLTIVRGGNNQESEIVAGAQEQGPYVYSGDYGVEGSTPSSRTCTSEQSGTNSPSTGVMLVSLRPIISRRVMMF